MEKDCSYASPHRTPPSRLRSISVRAHWLRGGAHLPGRLAPLGRPPSRPGRRPCPAPPPPWRPPGDLAAIRVVAARRVGRGVTVAAAAPSPTTAEGAGAGPDAGGDPSSAGPREGGLGGCGKRERGGGREEKGGAAAAGAAATTAPAQPPSPAQGPPALGPPWPRGGGWGGPPPGRPWWGGCSTGRGEMGCSPPANCGGGGAGRVRKLGKRGGERWPARNTRWEYEGECRRAREGMGSAAMDGLRQRQVEGPFEKKEKETADDMYTRREEKNRLKETSG